MQCAYQLEAHRAHARLSNPEPDIEQHEQRSATSQGALSPLQAEHARIQRQVRLLLLSRQRRRRRSPTHQRAATSVSTQAQIDSKLSVPPPPPPPPRPKPVNDDDGGDTKDTEGDEEDETERKLDDLLNMSAVSIEGVAATATSTED